MKRYFLLIPIFAFTLAGATGCWRHWSPEERVDHYASKLKSRLSLNDAQNAKLTDLANELKAVERETPRSDLKPQLLNLVNSPTVDAADVKSMIQNRRDEVGKRIDANFDRIFPKYKAFHESLTPEQRKEASEFIEKNWEQYHGHY
jgi:Spy/CpxP family protein refolding chaperone